MLYNILFIHIHAFYAHTCRLITRVVLLPFGTPSYSRTAAEQDAIDRALQTATNEAGGGVGVIVKLGKTLMHSSENEESELQAVIMPRIQGALPDAKPRIHLSYSMLLLSTLKVYRSHHRIIWHCKIDSCYSYSIYGL